MDKNNIPYCSVEQSLLLLTETLRRLFKDFHQQLLCDIRQLITDKKLQQKQWLKSSEVRKLLGISHGTLQTLGNKGKITFTKIGGVIYYSLEKIEKLLSEYNYFNS